MSMILHVSAHIRHQTMEAEDEDGEEMASGNDGGDASGSLEDELLIEAARRRRVVSSNVSSLADSYNRDETLQSMTCFILIVSTKFSILRSVSAKYCCKIKGYLADLSHYYFTFTSESS